MDFLFAVGFACLTATMSMPAHAQPQTPAAAADTADCPPMQLRPPKYPMALAKADKGGHGLVSVAFDDCGRVTDARMARSTGFPELDAASLEVARTWTLGKPKADWKLVDGRYEAPVDFLPPAAVEGASPKKLGWPGTHRRPRYELDSAAGTLPTFAEANGLIFEAFRQGRFSASVYRQGMFVATGSASAPEFWGQEAGVAARYRPVVENGEPVVKVAFVCAPAQEDCARHSGLLLKGLPFAKAKD